MSSQCPAQVMYEQKLAAEPNTRVAELMHQYRVSVREISRETGISITVLHGLRHGHHRMSVANAVTLAAFFGVTTEDLQRRWAGRTEEAA